RVHQIIKKEICLHAVGQGALGLECRERDEEILEILKVLEHEPTRDRCYAERAFLRELEGGCQVPIGVNTTIEGDTLTLTGMVASLDGQTLIKDTISGQREFAEHIGLDLAKCLRDTGGGQVLAGIFAQIERG
ncbi:MAG: hydroxymethylbilane synthase, partial [cyanobacterium endosymbiont of Rhopalodia inflata]